MELLIEGDGSGSVEEIRELREWLHEERLTDVRGLSQKTRPPKPGEQGPELLAVLQVLLATPAVLALVGCIKAYIIAKRPKTKITIKTEKGSVTIDAQNAKSADLERMAKTLAPS
ncbi:effector-associated constant component EACC1 [Bradyrhizobium sp.]|jgi:hypothetical protein|uniref:effector-associated constant component EACC1 n=1 Tax=Bradyrhizobium sp. TaxID=376 RepID=UPI002DFF5C82|nr:hypothetical protein [Bradyrhizobium sp.]